MAGGASVTAGATATRLDVPIVQAVQNNSLIIKNTHATDALILGDSA